MDQSHFSIPDGQVILFHETLSSYSFALTGNETVTPMANAGERWESFTTIADTVNELQAIVAEYPVAYPENATAQLMSMIFSTSSIDIEVGEVLRVTVPKLSPAISNKYYFT